MVDGIVAAQVPLGGGLAFAHKYRKDGGSPLLTTVMVLQPRTGRRNL